MPIDLGIDNPSDYEEELRVEDIGGRVIVYRPATTSQISAVSLELTGKRRNEGAVRDLLDSIILSVDEVKELAYGRDDEGEFDEEDILDEGYAGLLAKDKVVDLQFLLDRLKDPHYSFDSKQFNKLVSYLMEQRSGFPTKPSSDSSSGPTTTGRSSTGSSRRVGSTPSRSRRVGS